jgi:aryl-alcohol dehydrogenase-like predicted oxidoreductase
MSGVLIFGARALSPLLSALEAGINVLDIADVYGGRSPWTWKRGFGLSEEIIGWWLSGGGGRRGRLVLATKVYQPAAEV